MKRIYFFMVIACFWIFFSTCETLLAESINETQVYVEKAHLSRKSGEHVVEPEKNQQVDNQSASTEKALILHCNAIESNNTIPYPTAAFSLKGKFYIAQGKAAWLPPDPGEFGKTTILGVDIDRDCVRDDIERLIAKLLPNARQRKARKYLFEYARWLREFLRYPKLSTTTAKKMAAKLYQASACTRRIINDDVKSEYILDVVFSKFHNTFPRSYRYIRNNGLLGGWDTREIIAVSCP